MLRVQLLGGLGLGADDQGIQPPPGRPARALLAWLALHPGMHARSRVAAALWPDVLDSSARLSLRSALSALRGALGEEAGALTATREQIGLTGDVWVDVRRVDELLAAGGQEEAIELHRGELLPELDDEWVLEARDERRALLAEALARLADAEEERGKLEAAVRHSRELVAIAPLSESAQRALIRRLAASGDRGAALAAYEKLRERLRRELGIAPAAETRDLAERLRRGEVERRVRAAAGQPVPLLARRHRSPFVGRRTELERLRECWQLARRGERQLVLVSGEPGIGKSRLAAELARGVHEEGAAVMFGRCAEEPLLAYQPFVEALRPHLAAAQPGDGLAELATGVRALADHGPATPAVPAEPEGARLRLFEAVTSVLSSVSEQRPLLLVLEDLHWSDKPTLLLLRHLVSAAEPARLLTLVTYRETELPWADPLAHALAELRRERIGTRLRLGGLAERDVAALVAGWIGAAAAAQLADDVHRQTEGNPFFVEELLSHLSESGAALAEVGVPEGVKEVVARRLARLSDATQRTLTTAAVLGRRFDLHVLDAVLDDLPDDLLDAIDEATGAGLVRDEPGSVAHYAFSHALVRETLYEHLTSARRAELHGRTARVLDRLYSERPERAGEIAHHLFEAATPQAAARGIGYAVQAADVALDQLAYEDAAAQLGRALRALERVLPADGERRCELLLSLGDARMRAGERSDGRAAYGQAATAARALVRPDLLARAALGFGGIGVIVAAPDEALIALLEEALEALPDSDDELRATLLARLAVELYYTARERSESLSADAVSLARRAAHDRSLAGVLGARHVALWTPDWVHERLAIAEEMVEAAERAGDRLAALQGRNWRILDLFELGDIRAVEQELGAYGRLADDLRLPTYRWYLPFWRSTLAMLRGRPDEAKRLADEALELGLRAQDANAELFHRIVVAYHLPIDARRFDDADLEFNRRKAHEPPAHLAAAYGVGAARILAGLGRLEEARREFDLAGGEGGFRALPKDVNWLSTLAEASELTAIVGRPDHAEELYELLLPYADLNVVEGRAIYCYGSTAHYLGVLAASLGRLAAAVEHFEAARDLHERMGAGPLLCRTLYRHAEALRQSDRGRDHARAAELAREALSTAREIGMHSLIERAERAYAAARPPHESRSESGTPLAADSDRPHPHDCQLGQL